MACKFSSYLPLSIVLYDFQEDTDQDGIGDACDNDNDKDKDGTDDTRDNCPDHSNGDQLDTDKDGKGDVCDNDDDNDGIPDGNDPCPLIKNNSKY